MQNALSIQPMKDHLNIFVDGGMQVVNGPAVLDLARRAGLKISSFAKLLDVTRNYLYLKKLRVGDETRQRLVDLVRIIDNAFETADGNEEEVIVWLIAPNKGFYNMSPFEMAFTGKGKEVYEGQERLAGGY